MKDFQNLSGLVSRLKKSPQAIGMVRYRVEIVRICPWGVILALIDSNVE